MIGDIKKLEAREHILKYPDASLGSTCKSDLPRLGFNNDKGLTYITGYTPAAIRCLKEVLDNSIDAAIRSDFKCGINIHVSLNKKGFSIEDDGHGIPIKFNKKENMWAPQLAFSEERAGSNFDVDQRSTIGMYGIGIFATNVVSESLELITCDGKRIYSQLFGGNCSHMTEPEITNIKDKSSGTYVNIELDQNIINWSRQDMYCCLQLMNNIMFVYPEITITADIEGSNVDLLQGEKYIEALGIQPWFKVESEAIRGVFGFYEHRADLKGLVNGTECQGLHISTLKSSISIKLIDKLSKEIEDVARGDISKVLSGIMSFRILNPAFGGLTKTDLTGCNTVQLKEDINYIIDDIVKNLLDSELFKGAVQESVAKRLDRKIKSKERKAAKSRKSLKLIDVYQRGKKKREKTYLLITEGDSAKGLFLQARKPHRHAIYPLRGKPMNAVSAKDTDTVANNKILFELSIILGLSLTDEDIKPCRYDYIVSLTDADQDGASISGLLMGYLYTYWPDLFEEKRVLRLLTPSHIDVTKKKREYYYGKPPEIIKGKLEYIKGLASLTLTDVKYILNKPMFEVMILDKQASSTIEVVLGRSAEKKRIWLGQ